MMNFLVGSRTWFGWTCFGWVVLVSLGACAFARGESVPPPGSVYREYRFDAGNDNWRVTDDRAVDKFARAADFLPNPVLTIDVDTLNHAVSAVVILDRWGGHRGTVGKRICFNDFDWIDVPELNNLPVGIRGEMLMYQDNPVIAVPIGQLREGINAVEADCDESGGFGWGQWGMMSMTLRVFYDAEKIDHPVGRVSIANLQSGDVIGEHPTIRVDADAEDGVHRVELLARFAGYDEDGDGDHGGWHGNRMQGLRGETTHLQHHVGTRQTLPYEFRWDTTWVPDQPESTVGLVARMQDARGYWTVSPIVNELTLDRPGVAVSIHHARDVPEDFDVRVGESKSCFIDIPEHIIANDVATPASVRRARLHLRTWHGQDQPHDPIQINGHAFRIEGKNHLFDYDMLPIDADWLVGGENTISISSETEHHMLEVLWPGPSIVIRREWSDTAAQVTSATYEDREHFVIETSSATYWLDQRSGGLSRLIDRRGQDWIAFKSTPWDVYPASAAASYRGLPNLVYGGKDGGFGHPGWDRAVTTRLGDTSFVVDSVNADGERDDRFQMIWTFRDDRAELTVSRCPDDRGYWFLYEGPIGGRWSPSNDLIATNEQDWSPATEDFFGGERRRGAFDWVMIRDAESPVTLRITHETATDENDDTFAQLGNEKTGLASHDGMAVLGLGRRGTEPLLTGRHRFRIEMIDRKSASDH